MQVFQPAISTIGPIGSIARIGQRKFHLDGGGALANNHEIPDDFLLLYGNCTLL
jgi:hypothetical protein